MARCHGAALPSTAERRAGMGALAAGAAFYLPRTPGAALCAGYGNFGGKTMRLDKYLKVSRLIKRRTVANEACDAEKVSVNGKPARASYDVKTGDIIEINIGKTPLKVRVVKVAEVVGKDGAGDLYEVV